MNNGMNWWAVFAVYIVCLSLSSCRVIQKVVYFKSDHPKADKVVLKQLEETKFNSEYLSLRTKVVAKEGKERNSFKTNIRIKRDSAIWISISPAAGIEVIRVLITTDSLKFINRMERSYFVGGFDYLNKKFNVDVTFEIMQAMMLGNPVTFSDEGDLKVTYTKESEQYLVSTVKKRKLKRRLKKREKIAEDKLEEKQDKFDFVAYSFWLNQATMKIGRSAINDLKKNRSLTANYDDFRVVFPISEKQPLPFKNSYEIKTEGSTYTIKATHLKAVAGKPLKFPFRIPLKYVSKG